MNLDRGMIRRWKKNESFLRGIKNKGKRYRKNRIGGINKTMSEEEEEVEKEINNNLNKVMDLENNQINEELI